MTRSVLTLTALFGIAASAQTMIPAGTTFRVRTAEFIDVDSTQAGAEFRGTLDDPIMLEGSVIVPRGSDVVLVASKVEQGGKFKGSDLVQLKVNTISVGNRRYPVVTSLAETKSAGEGKKSTRKILGGTGLGAIIGGIAGGGAGAAIGAVSGAAAGTIISASGEPHLKIPAETRLTFQLLADWKVQ
jgi:outer membrane lipoprotein SlyB